MCYLWLYRTLSDHYMIMAGWWSSRSETNIRNEGKLHSTSAVRFLVRSWIYDSLELMNAYIFERKKKHGNNHILDEESTLVICHKISIKTTFGYKNIWSGKCFYRLRTKPEVIWSHLLVGEVMQKLCIVRSHSPKMLDSFCISIH